MMLEGSLFSIIFAVEQQLQQPNSHRALAFLKLVLEGNARFIGLYQLSKFYRLEACYQAIALVRKQERMQDWHNSSFLVFLKTLLHDLTRFHIKSQYYISDFNRPRVSTDFAKRHDRINTRTMEQFSGLLVVPLTQRFDIRLGDAKGACAGYVYSWLRYLLKGKKPFGIAYDKPYIEPILFNSKLGRACPDLNHCLPVNYEIADYQSRLMGGGLAHCGKPGRLFKRTLRQSAPLSMRLFINDLEQIFSHHESRGLYISLRSHSKGHAIGVYKDKQHTIHFLDANAGWFTFKSYKYFHEWLKFYFKQMRYDMTYIIYSIYEQSLKRTGQNPTQIKSSSILKDVKSYSYLCLKQSFTGWSITLEKKKHQNKTQPSPRFFRSQSMSDLSQPRDGLLASLNPSSKCKNN